MTYCWCVLFQHQKKYSSEEYHHRLQAFVSNWRKINAHNAGNHTFKSTVGTPFLRASRPWQEGASQMGKEINEWRHWLKGPLGAWGGQSSKPGSEAGLGWPQILAPPLFSEIQGVVALGRCWYPWMVVKFTGGVQKPCPVPAICGSSPEAKPLDCCWGSLFRDVPWTHEQPLRTPAFPPG